VRASLNPFEFYFVKLERGLKERYFLKHDLVRLRRIESCYKKRVTNSIVSRTVLERPAIAGDSPVSENSGTLVS